MRQNWAPHAVGNHAAYRNCPTSDARGISDRSHTQQEIATSLDIARTTIEDWIRGFDGIGNLAESVKAAASHNDGIGEGGKPRWQAPLYNLVDMLGVTPAQRTAHALWLACETKKAIAETLDMHHTTMCNDLITSDALLDYITGFSLN